MSTLLTIVDSWRWREWRKRFGSGMLAQYRVMCEIGNTFSEVVICRRFCPAGGQPFFRAFLRLPDHNPLKRLEAFFRVISSRRRRGTPHPTGPASFYSARCKTLLAARSCTPLSRLRNSNWNRSLRENPWPRAEHHPWRRLCKGGLIHPFLFPPS